MQLSPMNMKNFLNIAGTQQTHTSHAMALKCQLPRALVISHSLQSARPTCGAMNFVFRTRLADDSVTFLHLSLLCAPSHEWIVQEELSTRAQLSNSTTAS